MGLLNSQLFWFFIQNTGYVLRGGYYTFKTNYILPFPIPKIIPESTSTKIEILVEEILENVRINSQKDISFKEKEIDSLVYSLYNFSNEEIRLIDLFSSN